MVKELTPKQLAQRMDLDASLPYRPPITKDDKPHRMVRPSHLGAVPLPMGLVEVSDEPAPKYPPVEFDFDPEAQQIRQIPQFTAHFSHPFHMPESRIVGYSLYPHSVLREKGKTVRPSGNNDDGRRILIPSFHATLLPRDLEFMPKNPSFWYAKNGRETIKYNPDNDELYLDSGKRLPR